MVGIVVWDFKGQEGNSHEMEKQMFGKREMSVGPSLTMRHTEKLDQRGLARFLLITH